MSRVIVHIFNSSLISGPETLVVPALQAWGRDAQLVWLREERASSQGNKSVRTYFENSKLPFKEITVRSRTDAVAAQELADHLSSLDVQVAHSHDVKASFLLAWAARLIPNRNFPIVTTHHGVRARSGVIVRLQEIYYSAFIARAFDRLLCVCSADLPRLRMRGLPLEKIRVHLNGVSRNKIDSSERKTLQASIRKEWGVPSNAPVYGIVARLAHEKAHAFALDVLSEVKKQGQDFLVLCFGTGPLRNELVTKTARLGLQNHVRWMGHRAGLGQEFAGFDGVLSFSTAEGLPINLLEAGWAGTPVFARAIDGVIDLLGEPSRGNKSTFSERSTVAQAAQGLLTFIESERLNPVMGQELQTRVEADFSQATWLKRLDEIYTELESELASRAVKSQNVSNSSTEHIK